MQTAAINAEEIAELGTAGLDPSAVLDSATRAPAEYWGAASKAPGSVSVSETPGELDQLVVTAPQPS